jgi:hypothetical protein
MELDCGTRCAWHTYCSQSSQSYYPPSSAAANSLARGGEATNTNVSGAAEPHNATAEMLEDSWSNALGTWGGLDGCQIH